MLNSAQLVAEIAMRTESDGLNDHASGNVKDSLIPLGSSSKLGPLKETAVNLVRTASIELPDNSSRPPSTAFNCS